MSKSTISLLLTAVLVCVSAEYEVVPPLRDYVLKGSFAYNNLVTAVSTPNCVFAPGVSKLMSQKLAADFQDLCYLVQVKHGNSVVITVEEGFQEATKADISAEDTSLFFGARALRLSAKNKVGIVFSDLLGDVQAWNVFDFVEDAAGGLVYVSVLPDLCFNERPIDLAFLLDGSGSISPSEWEESKEFLEKVTGFFNISQGQSQVAISIYSSDTSAARNEDQFRCNDPKREFWYDATGFAGFASYDNPACICVRNHSTCVAPDGEECVEMLVTTSAWDGSLTGVTDTHVYPAKWGPLPNGKSRCEGGTANFEILGGGTLDHAETVLKFTTNATKVNTTINGLMQPTGGTHTSLGLMEIRENVMKEVSGMRGRAVPKVLIVLTDGASSKGYRPNNEAELLHAQGVNVIAVGVGNFDLNELKVIASSEENVLTVKEFSGLKEITKKVDTLTCGSCVSTTWREPVTVTVGGGGYVCVQPQCTSVPEGSLATVIVTNGSVSAFVSDSQFGGPLNNDLSDTTTSKVKALQIDGIAKPYIVLEGTAAQSSATVTFTTPDIDGGTVSAATAAWTTVLSLSERFPGYQFTINSQTVPGAFTLKNKNNGKIQTTKVSLPQAGVDSYEIEIGLDGGRKCGSVVKVRFNIVTAPPTTSLPTAPPTASPVTRAPTVTDATRKPTPAPTTPSPTVKVLTVSPTTKPTASPTTEIKVCKQTNAACADGRGMCVLDEETFIIFCQCNPGRFGPRCGPGAPDITPPGKYTALLTDPIGSELGQVEASADGELRFSLADTTVFTFELPSRNRRAIMAEDSIDTPLAIDPVTGLVTTSQLMPGAGDLAVEVIATVTVNGESNSSRVMLQVGMVETIPSPTPAPNVLPPAGIVLPTDPAAAESAVSNNSITGGGIAAIIIVFLLILFICMFFLFRRWQSNKDNKRDIFGHENPAYGEAKKREGDGRDGLFTNQLYSSVMPSEGEYADTQFSDPLYQVPLNPRSGAKVNDTYGNANQRPGVVNNALYADLEGVKSGADDLYMDPVPKANVDSYDENLYSDALPNNTNVLASGANAIAHYDSVRNVRKVHESDSQLYDVAGNNNESYMELDTNANNANVEQPLYDNTTGTNEQYLMVEQPNKRNSNRDSEYMDVVDGASTLDPNVGDDALYDTAGVTTSEPNRATVNVRPTVDENALYDTAGVTNPVDAAVDEATYDIATTAPTPTPSPRNVLQNAAYTTEEELAPLAEGWAATVDDAGNTYFYNSETQQSTWERPQSTAVRKRSVATRPGNKYWVESTYTQDDV